MVRGKEEKKDRKTDIFATVYTRPDMLDELR
jgi:hypothetical protein